MLWIESRVSQFLLENLYVTADTQNHICLHFASIERRSSYGHSQPIESQWILVFMFAIIVASTWTVSRVASRQINYLMLRLLAQHAIDLHTGLVKQIFFLSAKVELSENVFKLALEARRSRGFTAPHSVSIEVLTLWLDTLCRPCAAVYILNTFSCWIVCVSFFFIRHRNNNDW